jgi:hypothetical protein
VRRLIRIAFLLEAAIVSGQALSASPTELTAYAAIFSITQEAEKNCPNTYTSDAGILILKDETHISDKDDRALKAEVAKATAAIQRQIAEDGAAKWCKGILAQYGPKGSVQKILITR